MHNVILGKVGEEIACKYIIKLKYKILRRNYKNRIGEIDIIAKDVDEYVFIEVKCRENNNYGYPVESVNNRKMQKIKNTAKIYISNNCIENRRIRFDIIEIYIKEKILVNHIKNVFF